MRLAPSQARRRIYKRMEVGMDNIIQGCVTLTSSVAGLLIAKPIVDWAFKSHPVNVVIDKVFDYGYSRGYW